MNRWAVIVCGFVLLTQNGMSAIGGGSLQADEPVSAENSAVSRPAESAQPPVKPGKRSKRRPRTPPAKAAEATLAVESSSPRFQMLAAGKRVVILDTQTGDTRIIEPETTAVHQSVEIGKSWVTVTVLVNTPKRDRTRNGSPTTMNGK